MSQLTELVAFPLLQEGSILYALKHLDAATLTLPGVADQVAVAREAALRTANTRAEWAVAKSEPTARGKAVALDAQIDRALGSLVSMTDSLMRALPEDDATHQAAKAFSRLALPQGAAAIAQLSFENELIAVKTMLARIDAAGDLADRAGVRRIVDQIVELVPRFEAELSSRPKMIDHDTLRADEAAMNRAFAGVVIQVASAFRAPDADADLKAALAPILEQVDRIRAARKNRRRARDVDPQTGEEV